MWLVVGAAAAVENCLIIDGKYSQGKVGPQTLRWNSWRVL